MKLSIFNQFPIPQFLKQLFFSTSPILVYAVSGKSMEPTYRNGQKVMIVKKWLIVIKDNDIIVAKDPRNGRLILKRIERIKNDAYFLIGDNKDESTDSRHFGWVEKKHIIGRVISTKP